MSKEIIVERGTKTVYREGSKIVKQFKAGYPKSAVIKEAFNHALAEEVGLNVPELLEIKDTGEGFEAAADIMLFDIQSDYRCLSIRNGILYIVTDSTIVTVDIESGNATGYFPYGE